MSAATDDTVGARLCRLEEIPDGTGRGFTVTRRGSEIEVLVVRRGAEAYAYVNCCPHYGVTLEWTQDRFVSHTGEHIQCSTHGALFRFEDGYCVWGPCAGASLAKLPLVVRDGLLHMKD